MKPKGEEVEKMERLTIKNSDGTYSQPTHTTFEKMFYKLAEFEDFMEEVGAESLDELENCIVDLKQETQALKDRWQKLKEWFKKKDFDHCTSKDRALAKMQELEKE